MKTTGAITAGLLISVLAGCSSTPKAPDVAGNIRQTLKADGLKDVSVSQDRTKGLITLTGNVPGPGDKAMAENVAKQFAGGEAVSNEIAVLPPGAVSQTKTINSDLDKGIEENLDAALIQAGIKKYVNYDVKTGVVTLKGDVNSEAMRSQAAQVASTVPNVQQVVNEIQIKNQRASTSY